MAIHHKIIHHFHKGKEHIIAHIHRHHKKYLFGAGVAFGMIMIKVLIIAGAFVGINAMISHSNVNTEKIRVYQSLDAMIELDNFMHQKLNDINIRKDPNIIEMMEPFPELDYKYHYAENLNIKYVAAKNSLIFFESGYDLLQKLGYTTSDEDQEFEILINRFNQIK